MTPMAEIYANNLHKHFRVLFANFPPGTPLKLGDYGSMQGKIFVRRGNITGDLGINFTPREDPSPDDYEYKSDNSVEVTFQGKGTTTVGGGVTAKAGMEIRFSRKHSVFFYAAGCRIKSIEDQIALGKQIMDLFAQKKWDQGHVLISTLIEAGAATIVISGSKQAAIGLEASSDQVPAIKLGDASIGLSLKSEKNVSFKQITQSGLEPLLGLMKVQSKGLIGGRREVGPFIDHLPSPTELERDGIDVRDAFYFGKYQDPD